MAGLRPCTTDPDKEITRSRAIQGWAYSWRDTWTESSFWLPGLASPTSSTSAAWSSETTNPSQASRKRLQKSAKIAPPTSWKGFTKKTTGFVLYLVMKLSRATPSYSQYSWCVLRSPTGTITTVTSSTDQTTTRSGTGLPFPSHAYILMHRFRLFVHA